MDDDGCDGWWGWNDGWKVCASVNGGEGCCVGWAVAWSGEPDGEPEDSEERSEADEGMDWSCWNNVSQVGKVTM